MVLRDRWWLTVGVVGSLPVYLLFVLLFFLFNCTWFFLSLGLFVLFVTVVGFLLKFFFPRSRPGRRLVRRRSFWARVRHFDDASFPSVHVAFATGLVGLTWFFFVSWPFRVFVVLFFVFQVAGRLVRRRHDWWDVLGGLFVGVALAWLAWWLTPFLIPLFPSSSWSIG